MITNLEDRKKLWIHCLTTTNLKPYIEKSGKIKEEMQELQKKLDIEFDALDKELRVLLIVQQELKTNRSAFTLQPQQQEPKTINNDLNELTKTFIKTFETLEKNHLQDFEGL